jgi:hypothetical protein
MMGKQYGMALSLALGLFASPLSCIDVVFAQSGFSSSAETAPTQSEEPSSPRSAPSLEIAPSSQADHTDNSIENRAVLKAVIMSFFNSICLVAIVTLMPKNLLRRENTNRINSGIQTQERFLTELNPDQGEKIVRNVVKTLNNTSFNQVNTDTSEEQYMELLYRIRQLEAKNDELTNILKKSAEEIKPNVNLVPSSDPSGVTPLDYNPVTNTIANPADKYRKNPGRFKSIARVSLSQESLKNARQGKNEVLVLVPSSTGVFRVLCDTNHPNDSYLVPREDLPLSAGSLDMLNFFYALQNQPDATFSQSQPTHLAIVTPNGDGWELIERGKLRFIATTQSISSEKEIIQQEERVSALPKLELNSQSQNVEQINILQKLKTAFGNLSQDSPKTLSPEAPSSGTDERISNQSIPDWLEVYHKNPGRLSDRALIVDLTPDSAEQYFQGRLTHPPQFERQPNGKYWIIAGWIASDGKRFDYLVPKGNFQLKNMHNVESIRAYFDCNDSDNAHAKIKVIQPVVVSLLDNGEQWQLEGRGQLQFESSQQVENDA